MASTIREYLNIGNNLKKYREALGENQTEFSKRLGISRSTYSNYENNNRLPDQETLSMIAEVLKISIEDLIGSSNVKNEFESDFNLDLFDEEVMRYITTIKKALKQDLGANATNTLILQNIVLDRISEEEVLKELKLKPKSSVFIEFTMDSNKNLITGKEIKKILKSKYLQYYLDAKNKMLEDDYTRILEYKQINNIDALNSLRDYYSDIPKHRIKEYILEILYPEYIQQRKDDAEKFAIMDNRDDILRNPNNEESSVITGYYDGIED